MSGAQLKLKAQIMLGDEIAMGPGKADLLEAIEKTGSISAAGRALGMSYRRTWLLVDTMNRCWNEPLVETATGGSHGGGARLTTLGKQVVQSYRDMQKMVAECADESPFSVLLTAVRATPRAAKKP